jgi:hypothetical protein
VLARGALGSDCARDDEPISRSIAFRESRALLAFMRAKQRRVRVGEMVTALAYAHDCRHEEGEKWRALCRDRDGDLLEMVVVIEDGLLVVTLF